MDPGASILARTTWRTCQVDVKISSGAWLVLHRYIRSVPPVGPLNIIDHSLSQLQCSFSPWSALRSSISTFLYGVSPFLNSICSPNVEHRILAFILALTICQFRFNFDHPQLLSYPEAFIYVIPCGMIEAITNQQIGLKYHILPKSVGFFVSIFAFSSVISELIIGYALPGRPVAMML